MWLAVSGFMVMGLVSGWSLANHSNSKSFLVAHASLSQEGFWEVDRHAVFPFDLPRTLPVGGGLLVPYSLSGSPGAWPGWAVSVSVLPLTDSSLLKCDRYGGKGYFASRTIFKHLF